MADKIDGASGQTSSGSPHSLQPQGPGVSDAMAQQETELAPEKIGERYSRLRLIRPGSEGRMHRSLQQYGQLAPVVVSETAEGDLELIDGFKRLRAIRQIQTMPTLRARVLRFNERAAKAAVLGLNWVSHSISDLEEGWVVQALCNEDGLNQVEIGTLLGRDKSWVSRRLSLVERLHEEAQSQIRLGLINGTVGRELARLPRGNQGMMLEAIHHHGLCSREVTGLVKVLLAGTPSQYADYLKEPRRTLSLNGQWHQAQRDERLSAAGNRILRVLGRFDQSCRRVIRQLDVQGLNALASTDVQVLAKVIARARLASQQASIVLEEAQIPIKKQENENVFDEKPRGA